MLSLREDLSMGSSEPWTGRSSSEWGLDAASHKPMKASGWEGVGGLGSPRNLGRAPQCQPQQGSWVFLGQRASITCCFHIARAFIRTVSTPGDGRLPREAPQCQKR